MISNFFSVFSVLCVYGFLIFSVRFLLTSALSIFAWVLVGMVVMWFMVSSVS